MMIVKIGTRMSRTLSQATVGGGIAISKPHQSVQNRVVNKALVNIVLTRLTCKDRHSVSGRVDTGVIRKNGFACRVSQRQ